jgi:hypothetical protein
MSFATEREDTIDAHCYVVLLGLGGLRRKRGGGRSYSTRGAIVPAGTVYGREAEDRRLGL